MQSNNSKKNHIKAFEICDLKKKNCHAHPIFRIIFFLAYQVFNG